MATVTATNKKTRRYASKATRHATRQTLQATKGKVNIRAFVRLMEVC